MNCFANCTMEEHRPVELYDPKKYLDTYYYTLRMPHEQPQLLETLLAKYQEFFAKVPGGGKLVDIGTGATVHTLITASDKFKEITCAEYTEVNRKELKKWLAGAQDAFDWSLFFKFVAILEGRSESDCKMLEERVRSAVKDVVYCNVLKDPVMDDPSATYDVVSSTFCLEEVCKSQDDLKAAIKRMAGILNPNGHLIMAMLMEESSCKLDNGVITCLPITNDQLKGALKEAGFEIEEIHTYMPDPTEPAEVEDNDFSHALFILAKKL